MAKRKRKSPRKTVRSVSAGVARRPSARSRLVRYLYLFAGACIVVGVFFFMQYRPKPDFDGKQAFEYLERQVDFGPRSPGSEAHTRCAEFLETELRRFADRVSVQKFRYVDKVTGEPLEGKNIIAVFNEKPKIKKRVMLSAHWDTRPFADRNERGDLDSTHIDQAVPGANDGASGVAVLLEMARLFKYDPPDIGVDIVLFDLEDLGHEDGDKFPDSLNYYCIGSEYFANSGSYFPSYGINLDMVGDANLRLPWETNSYRAARAIVEKVWDAAERVGAAAFVREDGGSVYDDHIPFLKKGIRVIDIIDFEYPDENTNYWHTLEDTPDKCSVESLQQVGNTLVEVIYSEE